MLHLHVFDGDCLLLFVCLNEAEINKQWTRKYCTPNSARISTYPHPASVALSLIFHVNYSAVQLLYYTWAARSTEKYIYTVAVTQKYITVGILCIRLLHKQYFEFHLYLFVYCHACCLLIIHIIEFLTFLVPTSLFVFVTHICSGLQLSFQIHVEL